MGREESGYLVVVKRQARGSQSLGIGCQVDFACCNTGIQLSQPITPVTKTLQYRIQISHKEEVGAGIGRKRLIEPQMTSLPPVVPFF